MKLYKFRSLNSSSFGRIKTIIEENKFWCSKFYEMNDPMEGVYHSENTKFSEKIFDEKNKKVICSFSDKWGFKNPIMWGYYTDGFKGIAIEIEIKKKEVKKINYIANLHTLKSKNLFNNVDEILTTKLNKWKHEKEYRFMIESEENSHEIGKIKKIYIGNPYGNTFNKQNVIDNSKKIKEFLDLKDELEKFLKNKKIDYCSVKIEGNKVIELES